MYCSKVGGMDQYDYLCASGYLMHIICVCVCVCV